MWMIMNAVLAVALGLAPPEAQLVRADDYTGLVGRYSQATDRSGTTHLKGFDIRNGRTFDIAVTSSGHVEGSVGEMAVSFDFRKAA
jgi:hypothetical protein